jgi:hypothetical protein
MSDKKVLKSDELNGVTGGVSRIVGTGTKQPMDADVRSGPGVTYPQIGSLRNGTSVNTTGNASYNPQDGRTWYEINYPMYGWMWGTLLGFY